MSGTRYSQWLPSQATLLRNRRTRSVWHLTPVLEKIERRCARRVEADTERLSRFVERQAIGQLDGQ